MSEEQSSGVVFPMAQDGRRSTAEVGRQVVADALRHVDPVGARVVEQETSWRSGYVAHFRRALEAGLGSRADALSIARAGLRSLRRRMLVLVEDVEHPLADWPETATVLAGTEVRGTVDPETELSLPYHGDRLSGDALRRRVDAWVTEGVVEPTLAEAVDAVLAHPQWLRLEGHTVAVLGAGAEMGPLPSLMRWGARVAAVDLARPAIWERLRRVACDGAGILLVPSTGSAGADGVDLLTEVPAVTDWLEAQDGTLVVGNYVYADGATNVRVSMAVDELTRRLQEARGDVAVASLATPTDVFAVPADAVRHSSEAYASRSPGARLLGRPLRTLSGGRLLRRAYQPSADPGVSDTMIPQQGPNYALAKRLQRWRAVVARDGGSLVSMNVAPPTRTRSVLRNRALAAAYAGAHRFGVEVFDPATANVLMAALLVHDLHTDGGPRHEQPWQDEAYAAVHGGLWRTAYAPRSALGLAALLGYGATRG
jgi:hypothetical protein